MGLYWDGVKAVITNLIHLSPPLELHPRPSGKMDGSEFRLLIKLAAHHIITLDAAHVNGLSYPREKSVLRQREVMG